MTLFYRFHPSYQGPVSQHVAVAKIFTNPDFEQETDEAICFSILMNFDMKTLMAVPKATRVQCIWALLGDTVPLATLFVSGLRLQAKGFSWAPASFLDCTHVGPLMRHFCSTSPEGLRATIGPYTAFEVDAPQYLSEACFPCILQGKKYFVKRSPVQTNPSWEGLNLHLRSNLALILETP